MKQGIGNYQEQLHNSMMSVDTCILTCSVVEMKVNCSVNKGIQTQNILIMKSDKLTSS